MNQQLKLFTEEFKITEVGLEVTGTPDFEDWMDYGQVLKTLDGTARQFAIGDWIVHGFGHYEHGKWEMVQEVWGSASVLREYERCAKYVKSANRLADLSWTHHLTVADLPDDKQRHWLEQAALNKWSVSTLRQKISESTHITLIKGDMLEVLPSLGKFDLVVTDPPYGIDYNDTWDDKDNYHPERWLKAILPHLTDEYNMFWFCSPGLAASLEYMFKAYDLPIQSRIVWHRRNMAMGSKAKSKFVDSWEMILHVGTRDLNFPDEWSDAWFDVQTFAVPQTNFTDRKMHPTQKPEGLIERLVTFGSYPGDRIIDPFSGSGTTGAVCPDDRECVLIECEEGYIGITEGRLGIRRQG
jgi:DNA modification methylase